MKWSKSGSARPAGQAGRFYPAGPQELRREVERAIDAAPSVESEDPPIGFVSPHAGYTFSGGTAGRVYRQLRDLSPSTVFVFAPSHHSFFPLASIWDGPAYSTPLGDCPIDGETVAGLKERLPGLGCERGAETQEHSLEVQIPFLQVACPQAGLVPLLIGDQSKGNIKKVVEAIAALCAETAGMERGKIAFVASSDAYHGDSLDRCRQSDRRLAEAVRTMDVDAFYEETDSRRAMACGAGPIAAAMLLSQRLGATQATILGQATSADAMPYRAGSYVVGYLAAMFS
jgi:hypothetical protein